VPSEAPKPSKPSLGSQFYSLVIRHIELGFLDEVLISYTQVKITLDVAVNKLMMLVED